MLYKKRKSQLRNLLINNGMRPLDILRLTISKATTTLTLPTSPNFRKTGNARPSSDSKALRENLHQHQRHALILHSKFIHSDLRRKFSKTSFGKSNYYVTFIDDCTRYAWIYPIHAKSDTIKVFTSFINARHTQDNATIKRFKTDNGGAYLNAAMLILLDKQGIVHDLSPAYSHESNCVVK